MSETNWQTIAADYDVYRENTRPLKGDEWPGWEQNLLRLFKGKTHLNIAYIAAKEAECVEDHLLYARILFSMYREYAQFRNEHEGYRIYVAPGWEQVKLAVAAGQRMTAKELASYQQTYEEVSYYEKCTDSSSTQVSQAYASIDGLNDLPEFSIHDSKPVRFEHNEEYALLTLEYGDMRICLEFDHPFEIQMNGDPVCNWINDFYCYQSYNNKSRFIFDVGFYRIECNGVRVKSVQEILD